MSEAKKARIRVISRLTEPDGTESDVRIRLRAGGADE